MIPITCNAVGDIIAVATLVLDIARALDESRGSPAKYRAFTSELKSLHIVLASVARVAELTNDALLRDEIVREVDRCGNDVRRTLERVAKFSALGRDASSDDILRIRMKRQWYKLEWRFGYHGSAESVRDDLAMATQRLTVYLVVLNADGIHDLKASIADQFTTMTAQICTSLMEQFAGITSRHTELSRPAHYPPAAEGELQLTSRWDSPLFPGVLGNAPNGLDSSKAAAAALLCIAICTMHDTSRSLHSALLLAAFGILMCSMARDERATSPNVGYAQSNSITFRDAMGRRLVLPFELCETPELLHATLVNLFSRTKGSWFIHAHRYVIARRGEHMCIDDQNWNWAFQPGTEIEMFIVIQLTGPADAGTIWCPVCLVRRNLTGYYSSEVIWCVTYAPATHFISDSPRTVQDVEEH
ncbi:hypothetical protein PENSPDRAFT_363417 [Peniophora sp. CONT]|nr:hypothetical protein PENSPDRAFT_363417 [Peniophora sp. CONT]